MPPRTKGTHTWNIEHLNPGNLLQVQSILDKWCRCEVEIEELTDEEVKYRV